MPNTKFLNTAEAVYRMGGDEEIYTTILQTFAETYGAGVSPHPLGTLLSAKAEDVFRNERIRHEAHKIKGAAYTIGANVLGDAAAAVEKSANCAQNAVFSIPSEGSEEAESLLTAFKNAYTKTIEEINHELKAALSLKKAFL